MPKVLLDRRRLVVDACYKASFKSNLERVKFCSQYTEPAGRSGTDRRTRSHKSSIVLRAARPQTTGEPPVVTPTNLMVELILSCGLEGGGFDLYALPENDAALFYLSGSTIYLDENDDEDWRSWESEKVAGWENALQLLQQHQWWITIPTYIHPAYRANVLAAVLAQENIRSTAVRERWLQHCQPEADK